MAKLYFKYGVMGSSKTAEALMTRYRYEEIGQKALLCKTDIDQRDGELIIRSRIGLEGQCMLISQLRQMSNEDIKQYDAIIVDEAQFASISDIDFLSDVVDNLDVPVICYGLKADFRNRLFPGSKRLLEIADKIEEVKTVCWCGRKALCNARYDKNGIIREGNQVALGSNDSYVALCRKHYKLGMLEKPN